MPCKFRYKNSKVWTLKWYKHGKAYYESTHTHDAKVASYLLAKKEQELAEGRVPASMRDVNFKLALEEYQSHCEAHKTKKSVRTDRYYLDGYFKTHRMPETLQKFDSREFETSINARVTAKKIEQITANGWIRAFRTFFSWCVDKDYLDRNPLAKVKNFKVPEHLPRYLALDELVRLRTAAIGSGLEAFIETAIQEGLRSEELIFLDWQDIDFNNDLVWAINKPDFITKSKKARSIPLFAGLKKILLEIRKPKGRCFKIVNLRDKFDAIKVSAKLPDINLKCLRHTFGAYCALAGVPLPLLKEWMGHTKIETTMIYARLRPTSGSEWKEKVKFG
jgi:integrase